LKAVVPQLCPPWSPETSRHVSDAHDVTPEALCYGPAREQPAAGEYAPFPDLKKWKRLLTLGHDKKPVRTDMVRNPMMSDNL